MAFASFAFEYTLTVTSPVRIEAWLPPPPARAAPIRSGFTAESIAPCARGALSFTPCAKPATV